MKQHSKTSTSKHPFKSNLRNLGGSQPWIQKDNSTLSKKGTETLQSETGMRLGDPKEYTECMNKNILKQRHSLNPF